MAPVANDNDLEFGELALDLIEENGRTLILSRPTRVEIQTGENAGDSVSTPLSSASLTVSGAHLAGASAVDLGAAGVTGLLVAGDALTIDGEDYTVTGGPYQVAAGVIENVGISPVLAGDVSNGEAVTVTFSGSQTEITGFVTEVNRRYVDGDVVKTGDFEIYVSRVALEALGVTIEEGHEIYFGDTTSAPLALVLKVIPIPSGELDAAYRVLAGFRQ